MRSFLFCTVLSCFLSGLQGQDSTYVQVHAYHGRERKPVRFAHLIPLNEHYSGALTDEHGNAELSIGKKGSIGVHHPAYNSDTVHLSNTSDTIALNLESTPKKASGRANAENKVAVDTIFSKAGYSVVDHMLLGKDDLLMLIRWVHRARYYEKLVLRRPGGKDHQLVLKQEGRTLFRDHQGRPYLRGDGDVQRILFKEQGIELQKKEGVDPSAITTMNGNKVIRQRWQEADSSTRFEELQRVQQRSRFPAMEFKPPEQNITSYSMVKGGDTLWQQRYSTWQVRALEWKGYLLVFDPPEDRIHFIDEGGKVQRAIPISFHLTGDFTGNILRDRWNDRIYVVMNDGVPVVYELDPNTGLLGDGGLRSPVPFPKGLSVQNGAVYFTYNEPGRYGAGLYRIVER